MKQVSLSELAKKIGVNKSKLAYYFEMGLLKPITTIGRMNIFDEVQTMKTIKKIDVLQKSGKTLKDMKNIK